MKMPSTRAVRAARRPMVSLAVLATLVGAGGCNEGTTRPSAPEAAEPKVVELAFPPPPEAARFVYERTLVSSIDVEAVDRETRWRQILTGETTRGTALAKPFDVSLCKGRIYASDTVRRTIMVFAIGESRFFEFGSKDPGALAKPLGVATDDQCNVYVADGSQRRIQIYDRDGNFLRAVGGNDAFERLSHVTVDPAGTRVYAVDTGGVSTSRHSIRVYDAMTGEHLLDIGERGKGDGQFNLPRDAEVGRDGLLYVVDSGNFRVAVLRQDGTFVRNFGSLGRQYGQFARPKGIAIGGDGNVYVSDAAHGNFQIFSPDGQLLLFVGRRQETLDRAVYMLPAGIDVDEDGRVAMVDQFFRKIDLYRPAGMTASQGLLGSAGGGAPPP